MAASGFTITVFNVVAVSLRQAPTPDGILGAGRVRPSVLSWGALPVGALAAGLVADQLGVRVVIAACAAVACGLTIIAVTPLLRAERNRFVIDDSASR